MRARSIHFATALLAVPTLAAALQNGAAPRTPDSAAVILPGSPVVSGDRVRSRHSERQFLVTRDGVEREAGRLGVTIDRITTDRGPAIRSITSVTTPAGTTVDTVIVRAADLAPLHHRSHGPRRALILDFNGRSIAGAVTPAGLTASPVNHTTDTPVFDSAIMDLLVTALPLAPGFAARIPFYVFEQDGILWLDLAVAGTPDLDIDGVHFRTWEVLGRTDLGRVRYFVDQQTRDIVRTAFSAPDGSLARIDPVRKR